MPAYLSDLLRYHNQDPSRDESKIVDYLCFCAERVGAWPPFPCTADKMVRFMFFITRARMLSGGWEQALGWHRAVVRWFAPVQKDPFDVVERAFYEHVRGSFAATVRQRRSPKAPMTTELFAAIWNYLDTGSELDELERTLFLLYFVTGFRASTWALGSDRRGPHRLVKMDNISFFNADEGPGLHLRHLVPSGLAHPLGKPRRQPDAHRAFRSSPEHQRAARLRLRDVRGSRRGPQPRLRLFLSRFLSRQFLASGFLGP